MSPSPGIPSGRVRSSASSPDAVTTVWAEAFRVERRGIDYRAGLAGGLATSAPLAIGVAVGAPEIGVIACFGGLNAALGVPRGALRDRVGWGAGAALACCASTALATAVQDSTAASVAAASRRRARGVPAHVRARGRPHRLRDQRDLRDHERLPGRAAGRRRARAVVRAGLARAASSSWSPRTRATRRRRALARRRSRASSRAAPGSYREAIARDAALRAHALRLGSIVAGTLLLARALELEHGYWIPLTVLAVLQPEEHASSVRAVQRATGTLVGHRGDRGHDDRDRASSG